MWNTVIIIIYSVLWALFIAANLILGLMMKLFEKTRWLDLSMHTFSGMLIASTSFTALYSFNSSYPLLTVLFAFCITLSSGVLWEFAEFTLDRIFNTNHQRWKDGCNTGLTDTMKDLIAGAAGALVVCLGWLIAVII